MEIGHGISVGSLLCAVLAVGMPAWRSISDKGAPVLDSGASNMMCCSDEHHGTSILFRVQAHVTAFICLRRNQRCEFTMWLRRASIPVLSMEGIQAIEIEYFTPWLK